MADWRAARIDSYSDLDLELDLEEWNEAWILGSRAFSVGSEAKFVTGLCCGMSRQLKPKPKPRFVPVIGGLGGLSGHWSGGWGWGWGWGCRSRRKKRKTAETVRNEDQRLFRGYLFRKGILMLDL